MPTGYPMQPGDTKKPRGRPKKAMIVELPSDEPEVPAVEETEEGSESDKLIAEAKSTQAPRPPFTWVYRIDADTGVEKFLGKYKVGLVSETMIAQRFGGGKFIAYTRKPKAGGGYVYATKDEYTIDESVQPERIEPERGPVVDGFGKGDFIEKMLFASMQQSQQQSRDNAQAMMAMMTAVTTAISSMASGTRSAGPDPLVLEIVRGMVAKPAADPMEFAVKMMDMMKTTGHIDPLDQLKKVLEIKELLGGGDNGMDELGLMGKGLDIVGQMIVKQPQPSMSAPVSVPPVSERTESERPTLPEPPHTHAWGRRDMDGAPTSEPGAVIPRMEDDMPKVSVPLRLWKQGVAPMLDRAMFLASWMPSEAAAITLWSQANAEQRADILADIGVLPASASGEDDTEERYNAELEAVADKFVTRAITDFQLHVIPGMTKPAGAWISDTLYALFDCATVPDDEDEDEDEEPNTKTPGPLKIGDHEPDLTTKAAGLYDQS